MRYRPRTLLSGSISDCASPPPPLCLPWLSYQGDTSLQAKPGGRMCLPQVHAPGLGACAAGLGTCTHCSAHAPDPGACMVGIKTIFDISSTLVPQVLNRLNLVALVSRHKLARRPARIPLFLARYWLPGFLRPRELRRPRRASYFGGRV